MTARSLFEASHKVDPRAFLRGAADPTPFVIAETKAGLRTKIWDISPNFHCSIIGTCLTASELRQFFVKLKMGDAKTASDHDLHSRGVYTAGQREFSGKLLNKAIDKRHETAIKRFTKATTAVQVREMWNQALDQGDIPGAYWAVLTHPATDRALRNDVFGEVHMLSHLVGSSNRLDLARLRQLEKELGAASEKMAGQEARLQTAAQDRSELLRRIDVLESEISHRDVRDQTRQNASADHSLVTALEQKLETEKARSAALAARVVEFEKAVALAEARARQADETSDALRHEIAVLDATLHFDGVQSDLVTRDLTGLTCLYVGGRPRLLDQLRVLVEQRGGTLIAHDGGLEENIALLPGLVSQADGAFFPVDCISHTAAGKLKKICRDAGKPFIPLRTASVASFLAAVAREDLMPSLEAAAAV